MVVDLEKKEHYDLPEEYQNEFDEICKRETNFLNNIPLKIIEEFFYQKAQNMNGYVFVLYGKYQINMKVSELYLELETFYNEIFSLAGRMAHLYNLETKTQAETHNDIM